MNQNPFHRFSQFLGAALLLLSPMLCSAQVYKCTENGSVTFQSDPCKTGGKLMHIDSGPSAQAINEAKNRADKDKKSAWDKSASPTTSRNDAPEAHPPDCEKLNKAVADAEAQRKELIAPGIGSPTSAGIRNVNRLSGPVDQQYNYAKNMADASGCH